MIDPSARHFCTYFDSHYLARGVCMYESLRRFCGDLQLWILCLDDDVHKFFVERRWPGIRPISLAELEREDPALRPAKASRSRIEYYFTLTPVLPLHVLRHAPDARMVTYVDADLYFFADPAPLFEELGPGSISIISHRLDPAHPIYADLISHGKYNVGWLTFRSDEAGRACLAWWRERCIEWCYDRVEADRFADQKYLEKWPGLFRGVVEIGHLGANLAPWNVGRYQLGADADGVLVEGQRLIFFHFHGFKEPLPGVYDPSFFTYGAPMTPLLRDRVMLPYVTALRVAARRCDRGERGAPAGVRASSATALVARLKLAYRLVRGLLEGRFFSFSRSMNSWLERLSAAKRPARR